MRLANDNFRRVWIGIRHPCLDGTWSLLRETPEEPLALLAEKGRAEETALTREDLTIGDRQLRCDMGVRTGRRGSKA